MAHLCSISLGMKSAPSASIRPIGNRNPTATARSTAEATPTKLTPSSCPKDNAFAAHLGSEVVEVTLSVTVPTSRTGTPHGLFADSSQRRSGEWLPVESSSPPSFLGQRFIVVVVKPEGQPESKVSLGITGSDSVTERIPVENSPSHRQQRLVLADAVT